MTDPRRATIAALQDGLTDQQLRMVSAIACNPPSQIAMDMAERALGLCEARYAHGYDAGGVWSQNATEATSGQNSVPVTHNER